VRRRGTALVQDLPRCFNPNSGARTPDSSQLLVNGATFSGLGSFSRGQCYQHEEAGSYTRPAPGVVGTWCVNNQQNALGLRQRLLSPQTHAAVRRRLVKSVRPSPSLPRRFLESPWGMLGCGGKHTAADTQFGVLHSEAWIYLGRIVGADLQ
jgi:hypothetical protein